MRPRLSALTRPHAQAQPSEPPSKSQSFLPHSRQQLPCPLSAPERPLRSPGSGLVYVRASVCESECGSARALVAGDPRGPRPKKARAGGGSSLQALRCEASSVPRVQLPTSRRESRERLTTLVHSTGKAGLPERDSAASPRKKRRRKAGAPPRQLRDLFPVGETLQPPRKPERLGASAGEGVSRPQPLSPEAGRDRPRSPLAAAPSAATRSQSARWRQGQNRWLADRGGACGGACRYPWC